MLATPSTVNRLCAPLITGGIYSCGMYGRAVLNLLRWRYGAPAFHGDMTKYRRYLVNHEVGHLLGHSHVVPCLGRAGAGNDAADEGCRILPRERMAARVGALTP